MESFLKGALVGFLLLMCGAILFGPCGPRATIVYVLMFPGLQIVELSNATHGTWLIILIQLGTWGLIGLLIRKLRDRLSSH